MAAAPKRFGRGFQRSGVAAVDSLIGGEQRLFAPRAHAPQRASVEPIPKKAEQQAQPDGSQRASGGALSLAQLLEDDPHARDDQRKANQCHHQRKRSPAGMRARRRLQRAKFGEGNSVSNLHRGLF
jgi:hypothetical protein